MPDVKPVGLPDVPPDPGVLGVPINAPPAIVIPDAVPADPDREVVDSDGATHVVVADAMGDFRRGDRVKAADLPKGTDLVRLERLTPIPAIRRLHHHEQPTPKALAKDATVVPSVIPPVVSSVKAPLSGPPAK